MRDHQHDGDHRQETSISGEKEEKDVISRPNRDFRMLGQPIDESADEDPSLGVELSDQAIDQALLDQELAQTKENRDLHEAKHPGDQNQMSGPLVGQARAQSIRGDDPASCPDPGMGAVPMLVADIMEAHAVCSGVSSAWMKSSSRAFGLGMISSGATPPSDMTSSSGFKSGEPFSTLRCPLGSFHPEAKDYYLDNLKEVIKALGANNIAALLMEPINGSSGLAIYPPEGYWEEAQEILK